MGQQQLQTLGMHGFRGPCVRVRLADKSVVEADRYLHALVQFENTS